MYPIGFRPQADDARDCRLGLLDVCSGEFRLGDPHMGQLLVVAHFKDVSVGIVEVGRPNRLTLRSEYVLAPCAEFHPVPYKPGRHLFEFQSAHGQTQMVDWRSPNALSTTRESLNKAEKFALDEVQDSGPIDTDAWEAHFPLCKLLVSQWLEAENAYIKVKCAFCTRHPQH